MATAIVAGGPRRDVLDVAGSAVRHGRRKFSEGLLAVKYRSVDKKTGHVLGGPFYYIERGMGMKWRWLAKLFAFFGMCVGLFGIERSRRSTLSPAPSPGSSTPRRTPR